MKKPAWSREKCQQKKTPRRATEDRMGKTTWLGDQVQQAVESGMSVLISSLTKAAATEIGGRNLPISFDALGTLHSPLLPRPGKAGDRRGTGTSPAVERGRAENTG